MAGLVIIMRSFDFYSKYNGKLLEHFRKRKGMPLFTFLTGNSDRLMKNGLCREIWNLRALREKVMTVYTAVVTVEMKVSDGWGCDLEGELTGPPGGFVLEGGERKRVLLAF